MALPNFGPGLIHGRTQYLWKGKGLLVAIGERSTDSEIPLHTHELPSIASLLKGEHRFHDLDGKLRPSRQGAWYYRPSQETQRHLKVPRPIRTLMIEFEPRQIGLSDLPREGLVLDSPQALGLAERISIELMRNSREQALILEGLALQAIGLMLREGRSILSLEAPSWLLAAREIAHERFARGVSLPCVAGEVGVHPAHLSRAFSQVFGVPFSDYIIELRLTHAKEALRHSNSKISQIAADSGFSDHAHLTRAFRKRYECSPSEFRAEFGDVG